MLFLFARAVFFDVRKESCQVFSLTAPAEHYGRLGADAVTVDGDVAGRSAEAGIAGGEQCSQRAGRAGEDVLEIIGGKLRKALGIRNRAEKIVKSELIYN